MSYLTLTKNLKLKLSPGLVASYDIQPGNGLADWVYFWDTHIYLLTCSGPTQGGQKPTC